MPKCSVCEKENDSLQCKNCGFDGSRDYERYPSFGKVAGRIESVSAQRRALASEILHCPQCGGVNLSSNMKKQQCTCTTCGHRFPIPQQKRPKPAPKIFPKVLLAITACLALFLIVFFSIRATAWKENVLMSQPFSSAKFRDYTGGLSNQDIQSVTFLDSCAQAPADAWDVSADKNRSVLAWATKNGSYYDVYVAGNGGINAEKACSLLFYGCGSIQTITFGRAFHTKYATSMRSMFEHCKSLVSADVSNWNTSRVTNMNAMFFGCKNLRSLDLSKWDTSNVASVTMMFQSCNNLTIYGINNWDISKISHNYYAFLPEGHTINGRPWKEFFN